jgi:hypothetical protein
MIRSAPTAVVESKNSQAKNAESSWQAAEQLQEQSNLSDAGTLAAFPSVKKGFDLGRVPAKPNLWSTLNVQCCAKDGKPCGCSSCKEKQENDEEDFENETGSGAAAAVTASSRAQTQTQAAAPADTPAATPEATAQLAAQETAATDTTTATEETAVSETAETSTALLVDDSATDLSTGQMTKTEFLQQLRESICGSIGPILATVGQTTDGCPYLNYWLDLYQQKSASEVEATVKRYAPDSTSARTASDYVSIVTQRAYRAAAIWVATGRLPEGLPTTIPGQGSEGEATHSLTVRAKAKAGGAKKQDPEAIQQQLGSGQALPSDVRSRMEPAFGTSFSNVRLHADTTGSRLSNDVNARAFTVGNHVAFAQNEYQPGTLIGDALIAHELAHVVQQQGSEKTVSNMDNNSAEYNSLEQDADNAAAGVVGSLWGGESKNLLGNVMPNLRSGLRLQGCPSNPRLRKTTVAGPTTGDCGRYSWGVQWSLDNVTSTTNGWIVQNINSSHNVTDCSNVAKTDAEMRTLTRGWDPAWYPFWEGWQVVNGQILVGSGPGIHQADTFGWSGPGDDTKGTRQVTGVAEFFPNATLPSHMVPRNAPPAHSLPYTQTNPNLTGGTGSLQHDIGSAWDCCPRPDGTKNKTTTVNPV